MALPLAVLQGLFTFFLSYQIDLITFKSLIVALFLSFSPLSLSQIIFLLCFRLLSFQHLSYHFICFMVFHPFYFLVFELVKQTITLGKGAQIALSRRFLSSICCRRRKNVFAQGSLNRGRKKIATEKLNFIRENVKISQRRKLNFSFLCFV